jgi:hypothetical protein
MGRHPHGQPQDDAGGFEGEIVGVESVAWSLSGLLNGR